ncbi:DsbA family protein [Rhizobium alvei]|uniref:DsbA family protein n=1 Tax=Rhizobium alvei TaxID=1132659 RepID=A0ABT8YGW0_9HYPH|nr:DsbA family protein [Rhizobium alvei]MDO6962907.1 DsbA family protein [Rhizobium alvei]
MLTRRKTLALSLATIATSAMVGRAHAAQPTKSEVFFDRDAPVLGNPKGDVTVAEYFDYQCPYCKKSYDMVRRVVASDGNVRLLMKDWPVFGEVSAYAAQAALGAAEIGRYEAALDGLMRHDGKLDHEEVQSILADAGIGMPALIEAVNAKSGKINGLLDRNYAQAMAFNFIGTPSFVIGKDLYPGVLDEKALTAAIAKARKEKA